MDQKPGVLGMYSQVEVTSRNNYGGMELVLISKE